MSRRRRTRNDIGGILPAEEAAIKRALWESLRTVAEAKQNDKSSPPTKRRKKAEKSGSSSSRSTAGPSESIERVSEHADSPMCDSPWNNPSPCSATSNGSPMISDSGSLKLVLSTSSSSSISSSSSRLKSPCNSDSVNSGMKLSTSKSPKKSPKSKQTSHVGSCTPPGRKSKLLHDSKSSPTPKKKQHLLTGTPKTKKVTGDRNEVRTVNGKATVNGKGSVKQKKQNRKERVGDHIEATSGLVPESQDTIRADVASCTLHNGSSVTANDSAKSNGEASKEQQRTTFSCPYPAQRKFASNHTPPSRYAEQEALIANLKEIPKTEDFITFLCLRGSASVPDNLKIFSQPWTPPHCRHKKSRSIRPRSDNGKVSKSRQYGGGVVKKLVYPNRSPSSSSKPLSHSTSVLTSSPVKLAETQFK